MSNIIIISPKKYVLNELQMESLALEFYGYRTDKDSSLENMDFQFHTNENLEKFEKTLNDGFLAKKKK